jgi:hypothetical protein
MSSIHSHVPAAIRELAPELFAPYAAQLDALDSARTQAWDAVEAHANAARAAGAAHEAVAEHAIISGESPPPPPAVPPVPYFDNDAFRREAERLHQAQAAVVAANASTLLAAVHARRAELAAEEDRLSNALAAVQEQAHPLRVDGTAFTFLTRTAAAHRPPADEQGNREPLTHVQANDRDLEKELADALRAEARAGRGSRR